MPASSDWEVQMKTVQDWGFISKEQGLVKPKLQDNKIFHALTTAYENNNQQEIYGATENIVRREKELCEMALADLKKLSGGKGDPDGTLKLVMDHYQNRLEMSREKEEKINRISEDSRKMMEEYKKRTQELAEVKRNLMESQTKLRELAKNTEKLLKKEEELRFIETNLRVELDKNKRNIINGLYEIVTDVSDQISDQTTFQNEGVNISQAEANLNQPILNESPRVDATIHDVKTLEPLGNKTIFNETPAIGARELLSQAEKPNIAPVNVDPPRLFTEGLFRKQESRPTPAPVKESLADAVKDSPENVWNRDRQISAPIAFSGPISPPSQNQISGREGSLLDKAARLKIYEPGKSLVSKSMVKTQTGEIISEYFYSPLHPREGRHYVFNSLHAVWSLLSLKSTDIDAFQERLETVFNDLISRLEHSQNIHLESFLSQEINREVLAKLVLAPRETRPDLFESIASKLLSRIESVGAGRSGLIEIQFRQMPKPEYPPKPGLTA
jgi:hypothetical protein